MKKVLIAFIGVVIAGSLGYLRSIKIDESLTFKSTGNEVTKSG